MSEIDPELRERIDEPASEEAERDARLTPAEAVAQMRINVPAQRSRKLRAFLEGVPYARYDRKVQRAKGRGFHGR